MSASERHVRDNGDIEYRLDGKLHREDGPAIECANGTKHWYLNGKPIGSFYETKETWEETKLAYKKTMTVSKATYPQQQLSAIKLGTQVRLSDLDQRGCVGTLLAHQPTHNRPYLIGFTQKSGSAWPIKNKTSCEGLTETWGSPDLWPQDFTHAYWVHDQNVTVIIETVIPAPVQAKIRDLALGDVVDVEYSGWNEGATIIGKHVSGDVLVAWEKISPTKSREDGGVVSTYINGFSNTTYLDGLNIISARDKYPHSKWIGRDSVATRISEAPKVATLEHEDSDLEEKTNELIDRIEERVNRLDAKFSDEELSDAIDYMEKTIDLLPPEIPKTTQEWKTALKLLDDMGAMLAETEKKLLTKDEDEKKDPYVDLDRLNELIQSAIKSLPSIPLKELMLGDVVNIDELKIQGATLIGRNDTRMVKEGGEIILGFPENMVKEGGEIILGFPENTTLHGPLTSMTHYEGDVLLRPKEELAKSYPRRISVHGDKMAKLKEVKGVEMGKVDAIASLNQAVKELEAIAKEDAKAKTFAKMTEEALKMEVVKMRREEEAADKAMQAKRNDEAKAKIKAKELEDIARAEKVIQAMMKAKAIKTEEALAVESTKKHHPWIELKHKSQTPVPSTQEIRTLGLNDVVNVPTYKVVGGTIIGKAATDVLIGLPPDHHHHVGFNLDEMALRRWNDASYTKDAETLARQFPRALWVMASTQVELVEAYDLKVATPTLDGDVSGPSSHRIEEKGFGHIFKDIDWSKFDKWKAITEKDGGLTFMMEEPEPTFGEMLIDDAKQAGYRVAANQIVRGVKASILALMHKSGSPHIKALEEMLDTEYGASLISFLLGLGLQQTPWVEDPRVEKISEELRVEGLSQAGNATFQLLMEALLPVMTSALSKIPKEHIPLLEHDEIVDEEVPEEHMEVL